MKGTERFTSFIIERSHITSVEIAHSPRGFTLTAAGSFDSEIDFDNPGIFEPEGMSKREKIFAAEISSFLKRIGAGSKNFSFGLNSNMMMVQKIPVEQSLSDDEFNIHIAWELKNFFPEALPEQYIVMPYALAGTDGTPGNNGMIVGIRKTFVNFLNNVCEKCYGVLHVVDVDHFCAETAIMHNFPQAIKMPTAVIGIDEETVDCSMLYQGKNGDIVSIPWSGTELKKISDYAAANNAEQIFLHGRIVNEMTGEQLKQFTPLPVEVSDPFKKISLPATIKDIEIIKTQRQKYTAAVGLALRTE